MYRKITTNHHINQLLLIKIKRIKLALGRKKVYKDRAGAYQTVGTNQHNKNPICNDTATTTRDKLPLDTYSTCPKDTTKQLKCHCATEVEGEKHLV